MFQTFRRLAATTATTLMLSAVALSAHATPVVQMGSTYDLGIRGEVSGMTWVPSVVFDGVAQNFTRTRSDGVTLNMSVNESQQDLGNGQYKLFFDMFADGDIFPFQGTIGNNQNEREYGVMSIGAGANPLDLLLPAVQLDSVMLRVFNGAGQSLGAFEMIDLITKTQPWGGSIGDPGQMIGLGNPGNYDVRHIQFELLVSQPSAVPEPQSIALVLLALGALLGARRRRAAA